MATSLDPHPFRRWRPVRAAALLSLTACSTAQVALTAAGITGVASVTPTQDLREVYYFGVFDPQGQVPPSMYRVTVRGQASALSSMRFASGWVPAEFADTLGVNFKAVDGAIVTESAQDEQAKLALAEAMAAAAAAGRDVTSREDAKKRAEALVATKQGEVAVLKTNVEAAEEATKDPAKAVLDADRVLLGTKPTASLPDAQATAAKQLVTLESERVATDRVAKQATDAATDASAAVAAALATSAENSDAVQQARALEQKAVTAQQVAAKALEKVEVEIGKKASAVKDAELTKKLHDAATDRITAGDALAAVQKRKSDAAAAVASAEKSVDAAKSDVITAAAARDAALKSKDRADQFVQFAAAARVGAPDSASFSRRMVLFGPEGFREAPKDHRLVLVMGASPEKYFGAIGDSIGAVAQAQVGVQDDKLARDLFESMVQAKSDLDRLHTLRTAADADLKQ